MRLETAQFTQMSDEALCALAATGDQNAEECLVVRYHRLVRVCARPYFLAGADSEDLIQEGVLGLLAAIREYNPEKEARFRTFAEVCVKNRLYSAVRAAARGKHTPLNNGISFEPPLFSGGCDHYAYATNQEPLSNPEDVIINREEFQERLEELKGRLSGFEAKILRLYLNGLSCSEIASEIDKSPKSVDNAVQRIRRKMAQQL